MWNIDTIWFDISLVTSMTAFGTIFFGHFEIHTPKWKKFIKLCLFIAIIITLSSTLGHVWTYGFIAACVLAVIFIHAVVLPSKGINGWTAEPKEKYYKMRGWEKHLDNEQ